MDEVGPGGGLVALTGAGDGPGIQCLRQMNHLRHFISDVRGTRHPLGKSEGGDSPDDDIAIAGLASAVILPVIGGKAIDQRSGEFIFTAEKHPLPGNKDILEDDEGLAPYRAIAGVPLIDLALPLAAVIGLAAKYIEEARCIGGNGALQEDDL